MTLAQIIERMAAIKAELAVISERAEPLDDDAERADALLAEWDRLEADRKPLAERAERLDAVRATSLQQGAREPGFAAPEVVITNRSNPFENLDGVRSGLVPKDSLRSRALSAVADCDAPGVSDRARENATRLIEAGGPGVARHALLTGSPAYRSAFEKIIENPMGWQAFLTEEEADATRAALSTTAANGGYAIPFLLDPTIILTNDGSANPFRQISRVVRGTSNKWNGITSAGVTAEWKTEGGQAADASPTMAQPSITAYLADAYVFGSYEVFEDTNLASELPGLIMDAKDRLEADAFAVGSGSGAPFGVVTSVTAVTASRVSPTTGGTFTTASVADVYKPIAAVPPRNRSRSSWVANYATYNLIRQMSASAAGSAFWSNLGADVSERLLGRPIYEASAMASAFTTGSNILLAGDFDNYVIYDRIGMTLEYIQNVVGANQRPTAQRGWFATWRVGADVVSPNAFRVLKL